MTEKGRHHHEHDHDHGPPGFVANLWAGDHNPIARAGLVLLNLARRGRPGHSHGCCGNYGEPGC
ncbi:MAG TPA: hypothetical protein VEU76_09500 [Candidatus Udaeobacter sp.]|nr:hypothetical protein [Candidatus Udaeobacter sp.]